MTVSFRRHAHELRTKQMRDDRIHREAILRDHDFGIRIQQCVRDELDDFIRAIAENKIGRLDKKFLRQLALQIEGVAVGIKVRLLQRRLHRGQRQR